MTRRFEQKKKTTITTHHSHASFTKTVIRKSTNSVSIPGEVYSIDQVEQKKKEYWEVQIRATFRMKEIALPDGTLHVAMHRA